MDSPRRLGIGLAALFSALGVVFALVIPAGEAPDEPAHLFYIDSLIRSHSLPLRPAAFDSTNYEFFQPPLDYAVSALWLAAVNGGPIDFPFARNQEFSFAEAGSRAFLPNRQPAAVAASRALIALRVARLAWGLIAALFLFRTALFFLDGDPLRAALVSAPLMFAPQVLFVSASVNSDTALMALGAISLYYLCRLAGGDPPSVRVARVAGAAAGLALLAKASGAVLLPPLCFAAAGLLRRRCRRAAAGLLGTAGLGLAGAAALSVLRFGSLLAPIPAGHPSIHSVLLSTHWMGSLWISFWAKFGWLNILLPWPFYFLFLPATCLMLLGSAHTPRDLGLPKQESLGVMRVAVLSNVAFVVAYLTFVDWQPQGRYLFPSLAAFVALSAAGLRGLPSDALSSRRGRPVLVVTLALLVLLAAGAAFQIEVAYARADMRRVGLPRVGQDVFSTFLPW
ncbi:MAG TPA: glycosyltransferase family 39 protein [Thermoanaerobaculia bacterium]|nr:glycosyltransferase family 39 protein [Thermoanaerobaculia bacterium]